MNNKLLTILFYLFTIATAFSNQQSATLKIDGIEHKIYFDQDQKIKIGSKTHLINLKLDENTLFKIDEISFLYNSNMAYTEDKSDPEIIMWDVDGDSNIIMIQKYQVVVTNQLLVDMMKEQFQSMKATVTVKESKLKAEKITLRGFKLNIKFGDIYLSQEIYSKVIDGKTIGLIIQDTLNEDMSHTQEYKDNLELLKQSLKLK